MVISPVEFGYERAGLFRNFFDWAKPASTLTSNVGVEIDKLQKSFEKIFIMSP
jgi:hypothetical protein